MSLGNLVSRLQVIKIVTESDYIQRLRNNTYVKRLQELPQNLAFSDKVPDYSHVGQVKTRQQLIRLSAAVCGIELCYAAETAFVSPILLQLGVPVAFMTLVWCVSPLLGFFLVPFMGSLSDRCPLKLGRRRPFIMIFSAGIVLGLILVPNGETLGILAGDEGVLKTSMGEIYKNITTFPNINEMKFLETFANETNIALSSDSSLQMIASKVPHKQVIGILLTVVGVAMLDFNCDACQSPCRTYLLDISNPDDHSRGLTSFTVMAGLGGSFGYLMGGIHWESTSFGTALGGHVRVVFTAVLILFLVCILITLTSFKEIPLKELAVANEQFQSKVKYVKKAKYKKFENESSEEERDFNESEYVKEHPVSYGTVNSDKKAVEVSQSICTDNSKFVDEKESSERLPCDLKTLQAVHEMCTNSKKDVANLFDVELKELSEEVSLKTYLCSIIRMPRSLMILCLTNLFCWMSLVCYSLYFTDFVGQSVYGGNPKAPIGSAEHDLYDDGVRLGSFGMSLYSLSCSLYSLNVEYLVAKFSAKHVYVCGQLVYTIGMVVMAISRHPAAVILTSPCAGVMYATLFTMPYLLVAQYHTSGRFSQNQEHIATDIRGLGTDVAIVSSMVFLAQFLLSLMIGSFVEFSGSTVIVVIAASVLSFCGSVSATQVTYLDF